MKSDFSLSNISQVISRAMIYLMCGEMKQCFERSKLYFEYTESSFSIVSRSNDGDNRVPVDEVSHSYLQVQLS